MSADPAFLLLRFSAIGDCVLAAWAATAIRQRFPQARLFWAAETRCLPVIDTESLVTDLIEIPREEWKRNRWSPRTWRDQIVTYTRLRRQPLEFGLDLQGHSKTALMLRLSGARRRMANAATDRLAGMINPVLQPRPPHLHVVEWHLQALQTFGDFPTPVRPIMPALPVLDVPPNLVTISVGAGHPTKMIPADHWRSVAQGLIKAGHPVAFLGGPGDQAPDVQDALNWVGKLSLAQSMTAVAKSRIHVSGDTGSGHIAAAYGVPTVTVFGPMNPVWYRPFSTQATVLERNGDPRQISPEEIFGAVAQRLEESCPAS